MKTDFVNNFMSTTNVFTWTLNRPVTWPDQVLLLDIIFRSKVKVEPCNVMFWKGGEFTLLLCLNPGLFNHDLYLFKRCEYLITSTYFFTFKRSKLFKLLSNDPVVDLFAVFILYSEDNHFYFCRFYELAETWFFNVKEYMC